MNKIVSTKRTSAIFLAIVLVTGTFALTSPTFMTNAQATSDREKDYDNDEKESYKKDSYDSKYSSYKDDYKSEYSSYEKDDIDYDKSKDSKNVNIKKIKCNNINVNVNGIEPNVTSFPFLNGMTADDADASEGKYGIASYGNGGSYGDRHSDKDKDFKFVCINNNNNIVVVPEVPEEERGCEECLQTTLGVTQFQQFVDFLAERPPEARNTIDEFCELVKLLQVQDETTIPGIINEIDDAFDDAGFGTPNALATQFVQCLLDIGFLTPDPP